MDAAWVFVVLAAVVVLIALVVYVLPPRRDGRPTGHASRAARSSSGSLAQGFGYLRIGASGAARRGGVHVRLNRAIQRIEAVDPHASTRRVGEVLVEAGLADVPATSSAPTRPAWWVDPLDQQPKDPG